MSEIDRIYQKYISIFYEVDGGGMWIDLSAVRYAMRAALRELASAGQPGADIIEEHRHLDGIVRRCERVLEAHDSKLYADLVAGQIALPTAIDGMIASYKAALDAVAADNAKLTQELRTVRSYVVATPPSAWLQPRAKVREYARL